jgi:hypothetical protein
LKPLRLSTRLIDGFPRLNFAVADDDDASSECRFVVNIATSLITEEAAGRGAFITFLGRFQGSSENAARIHNGDYPFSLNPNQEIDLGVYGPFQNADLKTDELFAVKSFIFWGEPEEWCFPASESSNATLTDAATATDEMMIDITDDCTGSPHAEAQKHIPMYINEYGSTDYEQNVISRFAPDGTVHYLFSPSEPLLVGTSYELLTHYGAHYEPVRQRKGYGSAGSTTAHGGGLSTLEDMEEDISEYSLKHLTSALEWIRDVASGITCSKAIARLQQLLSPLKIRMNALGAVGTNILWVAASDASQQTSDMSDTVSPLTATRDVTLALQQHGSSDEEHVEDKPLCLICNGTMALSQGDTRTPNSCSVATSSDWLCTLCATMDSKLSKKRKRSGGQNDEPSCTRCRKGRGVCLHRGKEGGHLPIIINNTASESQRRARFKSSQMPSLPSAAVQKARRHCTRM